MSEIPVIAIDGPTASGKGTVACQLADRMSWNYLDSGSIYRAVALVTMWQKIAPADTESIVRIAINIPMSFHQKQILIDGKDVTATLRDEAVGNLASQIAINGQLRLALLERQRAFKTSPGLVAEGRDMGSVVFPDAPLKIFLDASVESRAKRRFDQLQARGEPAIMSDLVRDLLKRDARDKNRAHAPLVASFGAKYLDTSDMSASEATEKILSWWNERSKAS